MTSENSILIPWHDLGHGIGAHVIRVLRGTRCSAWGGTHAYRVGLDVLVTVHCPHCCCTPGSEPPCDHPIVPEFRVAYDPADGDAWYRIAQGESDAHVTTPSIAGSGNACLTLSFSEEGKE